MQNGYFQIVGEDNQYGIRIYPAKDGGLPVKASDAQAYLDQLRYDYDLKELYDAIQKQEGFFLPIGEGECPPIREDYKLEIAADAMEAKVIFYPPSSTGKRLSADEFIKDLKLRNIKSGIQYKLIKDHFSDEPSYCVPLGIALGKQPRNGSDAKIEYYFNTNPSIKPKEREDGTVDFYHLDVISPCKKGDVLARIIPADPGEYGENILGARIKPRDVKNLALKFGRNIQLSEDRLSITSLVDGHVTLVEEKVFVSDVFQVENVDLSTGNINFDGSVQVNGNVSSNFEVIASGNVIINGVVEGAKIQAGGNIIIARGMNGMSKGMLKAGGNIVAKFIENSYVEAGGYIDAESLLHTTASAGTDIILSGKKGFITGGEIHAGNKVSVKTLGANMGAATIIEVGVSPEKKREFAMLQKDIADIVKTIKTAQPVVAGYMEKKTRGARFTEEQTEYVKSMAKLIEEKKGELEQKSAMMQKLQEEFTPSEDAVVEVLGVAYPGTTIIIGDVSMSLQQSFQYCKFKKIGGEVRVSSI